MSNVQCVYTLISRFQELDLSKNAYIFSESPKEEEWYQMVKKCLHPDAKYMRVGTLNNCNNSNNEVQ